MRRQVSLAALLLALAFTAGCAHVLEFNVPKEFRGKKVKEDPPGVYAPELQRGPVPC